MNAPNEKAHSVPSAPEVFVPDRVLWRNSLVLRVMVLCAVLLVCLLGLVILIGHFYLREAIQDMQAQAGSIAEIIAVKYEENPGAAYEDLSHVAMEVHGGFDIDLEDYDGPPGARAVSHEVDDQGRLNRVWHYPFLLGDRPVLLTATVAISPPVEILRTFRNRYVMALIGVFIVTLGLMLYFITKSLRPLTELSGRCAAISRGELENVSTRAARGEILALEQTFNRMVDSLREKEHMEVKLRQAQRLSALGNLAAGVAHDVRNPLNAIKLLTSHALDNLDAENAPSAKPLATIRDEVGRLEEIVSSFLSLAKESELSPQPQRVDTLLGECLRLFKQDAESRGVRLVGELRAGDMELMLDPKQWTRAILNVLLNALEVCPEGGRVRLFSRLTGDTCEIEIRDDGPGMPKEAVERAFEPYYTSKPGGTGLGLSITRGIVEEHGGAVELSSSEGQGCQVLISLPLATTRAP